MASPGFSANPSIGYTSDLVVALGGKAILSEFSRAVRCGARAHQPHGRQQKKPRSLLTSCDAMSNPL